MSVLAVAAGLLIGVSLGALGGGGSILTVPALVYLLGESPHQATAASLIVVGIAAVFGAVTHYRAGRVELVSGLLFGVLGIAGSYAGSRASAAVPADVLLTGFGVLMVVVAVLMTVRKLPSGRIRKPGQVREPGQLRQPGQLREPGQVRASLRGSWRSVLLLVTAATAVGLITGFFGVGGGFVVVPALVLVLGFDMPTAAGTSLVVIAVNSVAALAARSGHGQLSLDWPLIGLFAGATVIGALSGSHLAGRIRPQRLAAAFTVLVVLVAVYTLVRSVPQIA
ncbi:MAG TPA: sulfite exporter TauE/SafE family protein [Streptosporangiaceae bacterium]|nr:sulfite exporter TauE/SafE family protein [Streptosporangiaceae bacterium]